MLDWYDRNNGSLGFGITYIIFLVVILIIGASRGIFANKDVALRTLNAQGYSDIQIMDHAWFVVGLRGCDGSDAARFTAKATNPAGKSAEVYVCTGVIFKGGTVRVR